MRYLNYHLIDFDEIYKAMHISRSDLIGDQKFDNLKIWKSKIVDRGHLKNKKNDISYVKFWQIFFYGGVDLASRTLGRDGKDGEDGDLK